jgi:eukaryotic-like serine/threonine-protein kinase
MYEFGPFRVDVVRRQLLKEGNVVPLTAKVFDTLLVLVRNHDRPVMKEELIHAVWPGSFVSDDSLVQNISALRRALGDDSSQPRYIATLARRGYRFIAPTTAHTETGVATTATAEVTSESREFPRTAAAQAGDPTSRRWAAIAVVLGIALATVAVTLLLRNREPAPAPQSFRFQEPIPEGLQLRSAAVLSPDGRQVAFSAEDSAGVENIWVRPLDAPEARRIPGTEDGRSPFWSPDGLSVGFSTSGEIKRVTLDSGTVRAIVPTHRTRPLGASWGSNDVILYADLGKLYSVPAAGGKATVVLDSGPSGQHGELRYPQWLADARHFVFYASGRSQEQSGTYLGTVGSAETVQILRGFRATLAPPGYLLYVRDRTLMAQKFDADTGRLDGTPMALPGNVSPTADLSSSANGVLAIRESQGTERLVWFDRQGKPLSSMNLPRQFTDVALSPDEKQLLASGVEAGTWELWLIDLQRQVSTKVATDSTFAAWAPDGTRFAYTLVGGQGADVYVKSMGASGFEDAPWLKTEELKAVNSWTPDGRFIVFNKYNTRDQTSQDLWLLPTSGDRKPMPFVETRATEREASVSPDGRAIAYSSDETGTAEVYVQSFPTPGLKIRISNGGGNQPVWRADGRELFYLSGDRRLMAVAIAGNLTPGQAQPLFRLPPINASRQFAASSDGQRFIVLDWDGTQQEQSQITVITNWEALQRP